MTLRLLVLAIVAALACGIATHRGALAQQPSTTPPDESVLGTVEVNGSAGGWGQVPLQKLAVVPLATLSNADSMVQLITKRDIDLSGQFDVIADGLAPPGPWTLSTPIDWLPWLDVKVEVIVRVYGEASKVAGKTTLVGEIYLPPSKEEVKAAKGDGKADAGPPVPLPPAKAAFTTRVEAGNNELRAASHRLVDALLGGLTGRPGSFASQIAYAGRVGKWRQIFVLDADGFNLHPVGPANGSALSPVFGPGGEVFYTLSADFHRYKIVHGNSAALLPINLYGSILGLAFSPDRKSLALASFENGTGTIYMSSPTGAAFRQVSTEPNANHPAIGPNGKVAYVAGRDAQRVYIDGKALSPPGFLASAPTFCDSEKGLLVVFTVGFGAWADVIAIDVNGGGIRRLTQGMGANSSASCSPDGRLVAFFSDRGMPGKGPGMYMLPIARPWLGKKIAGEVGEGLRWDAIVPR
jgi:TolB protein